MYYFVVVLLRVVGTVLFINSHGQGQFFFSKCIQDKSCMHYFVVVMLRAVEVLLYINFHRY